MILSVPTTLTIDCAKYEQCIVYEVILLIYKANSLVLFTVSKVFTGADI